MATHLYVSPETFKASTSVPDGLGDEDVERALAAASGAVEELAHRKFWLDPEPTTRTFTALTSRMMVVNDLASFTSVTSKGTAVTDVVGEPLNAPVDGKPFLWLVSPGHGFSTDHAAIEVTGRFGWPEVPDQVPQFVSIVAAKLLKRTREAPFGIVSPGLDGPAMRLGREDPDARMLLRPLVRHFPVVA